MGNSTPPNEPTEPLIDLLGLRFGVDPGRLASVMASVRELVNERVIPSMLPETDRRDVHATYILALFSALEACSPPEDAFHLFEQDDPTSLVDRFSAFLELLQPATPLYTRVRLAELLRSYDIFRAKYRDLLIQTGFPSLGFGASPWIDSHFVPLIPTKLPYSAYAVPSGRHGRSQPLFNGEFVVGASDHRPRDQAGNLTHTYTWMTEVAGPEADYVLTDLDTAGPIHLRECSYEQVEFSPHVPERFLSALEEMRPHILDVSLRVLRICASALVSGDGRELVRRAYHEFTSSLTPQIYRRVLDTLAAAMPTNETLTSLFGPGVNVAFRSNAIPGALCLAAHCQAEIEVGAYHEVASRIGEVVGETTTHSSYFRLRACALRPLLDGALDEFNRRVGVQNRRKMELHSQLIDYLWVGDPDRRLFTCTRLVHRDHFETLQLAFRAPASGMALLSLLPTDGSVCANSLKAPSPEPKPTPQITRANQFSRSGEHWILRFAGKTATMKNRAGMAAIALLLSRPGETVSLLEIDIRASQRSAVAALPTIERSSLGADGADHLQTDRFTTQPVTDNRGRSLLRRQRKLVDAQLADARDSGDPGAIVLAADECRTVAELEAKTIGQAGRTRSFDGRIAGLSQNTLSKQCVTCWQAMVPHLPELALHIKEHIHIRTAGCVYMPSPPIDWDTEAIKPDTAT